MMSAHVSVSIVHQLFLYITRLIQGWIEFDVRCGSALRARVTLRGYGKNTRLVDEKFDKVGFRIVRVM